jgi:hypothetical protein
MINIQERFLKDLDYIQEKIPSSRITLMGCPSDPMNIEVSVEIYNGCSKTRTISRNLRITRLPYVSAEVDDNLPNIRNYIDYWCDRFNEIVNKELYE